VEVQPVLKAGTTGPTGHGSTALRLFPGIVQDTTGALNAGNRCPGNATETQQKRFSNHLKLLKPKDVTVL
jgi:ABC-type transport system involved in cytochrome c biogenesis ATPase subunit